jgi:riboflavin transporter 2
VSEPSKLLSQFNYRYLMTLMFVVCMFANGVFPSIQSYSCLPYGNVAYHLTVTLSSIANPVACFLAVFLPHHSVRHITTLTVMAGLVACYALSTAFLSPSPPLQNNTFGAILVVSIHCFFIFNCELFSVKKVMFSRSEILYR